LGKFQSMKRLEGKFLNKKTLEKFNLFVIFLNIIEKFI
jgi:hypothetical protein